MIASIASITLIAAGPRPMRGVLVDDPRGATLAPRGVFGACAATVGVALAVIGCGRARPTAQRDGAADVARDAAIVDGRDGRDGRDGSLAAARDGHRAPPAGWTDVAAAVPDAVLDLRYATAHNLTGAPLYPVARCLLRDAVAARLARAARLLAARGHRLVMWDCYRPASMQLELWRRVPDPRFVAEPRFTADGRPVSGSRHSRGAAVDISLADRVGAPRSMATDHDDFGPAASGARATGDAARWLADLRTAMTAAGFTALASEWWHFDATDAMAYPLADEPLD